MTSLFPALVSGIFNRSPSNSERMTSPQEAPIVSVFHRSPSATVEDDERRRFYGINPRFPTIAPSRSILESFPIFEPNSVTNSESVPATSSGFSEEAIIYDYQTVPCSGKIVPSASYYLHGERGIVFSLCSTSKLCDIGMGKYTENSYKPVPAITNLEQNRI